MSSSNNIARAIAASGKLREILCLEDFEAPARSFLPRPIFGFISGGVESNASRDGNRAAFSEYAFLPRVLVNTRARNQKTTLFGRTYDLPFGFPPMGGTALAAYDGDIVLAKAAADLNTVMIQSGAALTTMERVKEAGPTAWFQAYLPGDPSIITPVGARRAYRVRGAGADGGRAGVVEPREQCAYRLQFAVKTDAAPGVGLHAAARLDARYFRAHRHDSRHAAYREHGLRAHAGAGQS